MMMRIITALTTIKAIITESHIVETKGNQK
jgi:hypothetical protein